MNTGTKIHQLETLENLPVLTTKMAKSKGTQLIPKYYPRAVYRVISIDRELRNSGKFYINDGAHRQFIQGKGLNPNIKIHGKSIDFEILDAPAGSPNMVRIHSLDNMHGNVQENRLGITIAPARWLHASLAHKADGIITPELKKLETLVYSI